MCQTDRLQELLRGRQQEGSIASASPQNLADAKSRRRGKDDLSRGAKAGFEDDNLPPVLALAFGELCFFLAQPLFLAGKRDMVGREDHVRAQRGTIADFGGQRVQGTDPFDRPQRGPVKRAVARTAGQFDRRRLAVLAADELHGNRAFGQESW